MKKYIYAMLTFACLAFAGCKSNDDMEPVDNPAEATQQDEDDDNTTSTLNDSYTYQLPVIFHVLYSDPNDSKQYVSATTLKNILSYVNEIYKGNVYGKSEDIKLSFNLAQYDENGKKLETPGVEYIQYPGTYPIDCHAFMSDNTGANAKYLWDPNEYINVMLYNFKASDTKAGVTLGISDMPYTLKGDSALAGLDTVQVSSIKKSNLSYAYCSSINSLYINDMSSRYTAADKGASGYTYYASDIVVTLAHELGHYLGLHHIFTENKSGSYQEVDSCYDSDYCKDTPSYLRAEYEDYMNEYSKKHSSLSTDDFYALLRRTNCSNETFLSANIMDYSIGLGYKISADQKRRIRSVLYNSPLIPGPKVRTTATTRSPEEGYEGVLDLPIHWVECKLVGGQRIENIK
ncbi:MAG TPA: zinc-dependent metalloproteinase lipoprotein [Prevotella sp.]|nr:zinc-dependent metalloproteinase lipoprotein [Prevotella sp.]